MRRSLLVLAVALVWASAGQAGEKKKSLHDQVTGQGYGMAGCGLGSIVYGDSPGMIQIIAATINATGVQTVGITFGTSNCGASGKTARANQFIDVNKVTLEKDLARGEGETIASLQQVMGCKNDDFASTLRISYVPGSNNETLAQAASNACVE